MLRDRQILTNIGWLFVDKFLRLGFGFIIGVWTARYLGPELFGKYNYTIAFISIFSTIASLGLNGIVVRDVIENRQNVLTTLGSSAVILVTSGCTAFALSLISSAYFVGADHEQRLLIWIYAITLTVRVGDVVRFWYEAEVRSKYTVRVEGAVFLVFGALRLAVILRHGRVVDLVWLLVAEQITSLVGLFVMYQYTTRDLLKWRITRDRAIGILRDAFPILLSAVGITIYMRIDQVMLESYLGPRAVGVYSAALRLSEIWYILPTIVTSSVFPSILRQRSVSIDKYNHKMRCLLSMLTQVAIVISCVVVFAARPTILIIYGQSYAGAATVLVLHIWTSVFVFQGVAASNWYIAEGLQRTTLVRTATGALVNIVLNIVLIPSIGLAGAALATLVSQCWVNYFGDLFDKSTRRLFRMKTAALVFWKFNPLVMLNHE